MPRSKNSGRSDYFAVNDKPMGVSTSFRVSGRLGELARRFWCFSEANKDAKRLNRAYELGYQHGVMAATDEADFQLTGGLAL